MGIQLCKMNCNGTNMTSDPELPTIFISKVSVVVLLLIATVAVNIALWKCIHFQKRTKWKAADYLLQALAVVGLMNGVVNITAYMANLLTGTWLLGNAGCQVFGLLSSVLVSGWVWLLTIALMERYKSLMKETGYTSLFSEVNSRIILWGILLLLCVLYLAPVYGWGEYSFLKGKLDIIISVQNYTLIVQENAGYSLQTVNQLFFAYLQGNSSEETHVMQMTKDVFRDMEAMSIRPHYFATDGLKFPIRAYSLQSLDCVWNNYMSHNMNETLTKILVTNDSRAFLHVETFQIHVSIDETEYIQYRDLYHVYQRSSTCGFDYSPVNRNLHTFVGFSWICTLLLPIIFSSYFTFHIFCWNRNMTHSNSYFTNGISDGVIRAQIIAYAMFITIGCALPSHIMQLTAGQGYYISGFAHYVSNVLMFTSWCVLSVFYFCSSYWDICFQCDSCCCCRIFLMCCRKKKTNKNWVRNDRHKKCGAHEKVEADVCTSLLSVTRQNSDASAVVSEKISVRLSDCTEESETCV